MEELELDPYENFTIDDIDLFEDGLVNAGIPKFSEMKITTITGQCKLSGKVNYELASHLLPITEAKVKCKKKSSKCKIPHCSVGSIVCIGKGDTYYGIIKSVKMPFPNSVSLDMSISHKNIHCKISKATIHFTGASKIDDIHEAAQLLISHLFHIQLNLDRMRSDLDKSRRIIEWLLEFYRGDVTNKVRIELRTNKVQFVIKEKEMYTRIHNRNIERHDIPLEYVEDFELIQYLSTFRHRVESHEDLALYYEKILNLDDNLNIYEQLENKLTYGDVETTMVNYNYNLGFSVDMDAVNKIIDNKIGFNTHFDPSVHLCVRIQLPYEEIKEMEEEDNSDEEMKVKQEPKKHTLMIYKHGSVTQSSRTIASARETYLKFRYLVYMHENEIKMFSFPN